MNPILERRARKTASPSFGRFGGQTPRRFRFKRRGASRPQVEKVLLRLAVASYCIPIIAIGPILVFALPGDRPKAVLAGLLVFFPTLVGVAIAVFFLIRVMPGDVVVVKLRADGAAVSEETIQAERKRLGLDKPLYEQFIDYMVGLPSLDLGKSLWTGEPVTKEIALRMPVSFQIAIMAGLIAIAIAIPLGTLSAVYRDTWVDQVVRVVAVSGLAIPSFWLGMLIIICC